MVHTLLNIYVVLMLICACDCKICELLPPDDVSTSKNVTSELDRTVHFKIIPTGRGIDIFSPDSEGCWINTTDLYLTIMTKHELQGTEKANYLLELQLECLNFNVVKFMQLDTVENVQQHLHIALILKSCHTELHQLEEFRKFGTIVGLSIEHNSMVYNSEKSCFHGLSPLMLSVGTDCKNLQSTRKLFWEDCQLIFPEVSILTIQGCVAQKLEFNPVTLKQYFPSLDTLYLEHCTISDDLYFPWNAENEQNYQHTKTLINKLREYVKTKIADLEFPESSLWIKSSTVKPNFLHLDGKLDAMAIQQLDPLFQPTPTLFNNISIKNQLVITDNGMETIDSHLFEGQSQLITLYLYDNNLTHLTSTMFQDLKQVRNINLKNNEIEVIESDTFETLYHLEVIDLSNNNIKYLPSNMFRNQVNSLTELYLNNNELTHIPLWPLYSESLKIVDLSYGKVTGQSVFQVVAQLNILDASRLGESIPVLDLSYNNITTIPNKAPSYELFPSFETLFTTFSVKVTGNPFVCNCNTDFMQNIISRSRFKDGWTCASPPELKGREISSIVAWIDQYCPFNATGCPKLCQCFKKEGSEVVIVDCRNTAVKQLPEVLPHNDLELWFQNSSISKIDDLTYLENITVLKLDNNKLENLTPDVINQLTRVRTFNLHSNHLTSLPIQIHSLNISKLFLSDNPFICDCTSKWMKNWLLESEDIILDWADVKCMDNKDTVKQLIAVPDSSFVCTRPTTISIAEHVFLPSVITGSFLFILVILSLVIYFYRFNLKVLLFIHFKLHPFDKEPVKTNKHIWYHAVVINCHQDTHCQETIIPYLIKKGYKIADIYKNSLIGYSLMTNIELLINHSKRVILYMTQDSANNHLMELAWCTAYEKAITGSMGSIILIADKTLKKQQNLTDSLQQFLKSNHFIDRHKRLLEQKVEYLMPNLKQIQAVDIELCNNGNIDEETPEAEMADITKTKILVSYPDENHDYVKQELVPFLIGHNLDVKLLDMEFTFGSDIREELPRILDAAQHMIFILSCDTLKDEVKMFILTQIITKAQLESHNYLLLCTSGQIQTEIMGNDFSKYVESYVTISVTDIAFKERILESIKQSKPEVREAAENSETVPLI